MPPSPMVALMTKRSAVSVATRGSPWSRALAAMRGSSMVAITLRMRWRTQGCSASR